MSWTCQYTQEWQPRGWHSNLVLPMGVSCMKSHARSMNSTRSMKMVATGHPHQAKTKIYKA